MNDIWNIPKGVAAAFVRDLTDVTRRHGVVIRGLGLDQPYVEPLDTSATGGYVLEPYGSNNPYLELKWQENGPGLSVGWRALDEPTAEGYVYTEIIEPG